MDPEIDLAVDDSIAKDSSVRSRIKERFKYATEKYSDWISTAKEDYRFALGDQWTAEERAALEEQARPCLTYNRIRPLLNLVTGYQRENSARIKVNPEGGEDRIFSEVMDRAIKAVGKWSHLDYKFGYQFDDGCYCGKGWLEAIISYDKDPIRGEIQFKLRAPYEILPDPDFKEYDLNDGARYCFKAPVKLSKQELLELYPAKKKIISSLYKDSNEDDPIESVSPDLIHRESTDDDYGNRPEIATSAKISDADESSGLPMDEKFTVKEYWEIKRVPKYFVIDIDSGEPVRFDTKEEAEALILKQASGEVVERKVPEMWVYALCAGHILQEEKSPFEPFYSGYPFFRFIADWAPNAESEVSRVQGLTRALKDPQREKNKAKSQSLHILNTQANSGWVGDEDALSEPGWKQLEKMGSKPGITIRKKKGAELREILPKGPNAGHLQREEKADEEFKQISGINPDLMGFQEGTASGRAISMRIKQAILSLVRLFSNYHYSKEIVGGFILQMTPMLFDVKKLKKVIGEDYMRKALDPQKYPEGLGEGHIAAFLTMVKDHKYDVVVTEAGQNSTLRFEIFQELVELLKSGAQIPVDLLIDYMDLPNSEEVKQKIKDEAAKMSAATAAKSNPGAQ